MRKNKIIKFGDIILDPDTDTYYYAVSVGCSTVKLKRYILVFELSDDFKIIDGSFKPFDRATLANFVFVKNNKDDLILYMQAMSLVVSEIKVVDLNFNVLRSKN